MSLDYIDGQIESLREKAHTANNHLRSHRDAVMADRLLSDDGKKESLNAARTQASETIEKLQQEENALVAAKLESLERTVIGTAGSDPSSVINYRDAQDRAERITEEPDAARVMTRAIRSGDKSLAAAVAQTALANGWSDVYQAFADANPTIAEAANDLATLTQFANDVRFGLERAMIYAVNA